MADYILEMRNITKEFPGVKALDGVNVVEAKTTLENAKKLIAALPPYYVEDALKALFQEVSE